MRNYKVNLSVMLSHLLDRDPPTYTLDPGFLSNHNEVDLMLTIIANLLDKYSP
jgi:hypothetical protein